jgi:LuxR family maltose regulon positive regulatory protein
LKEAATWHLERGDVSHAVEYLLKAKDWDGALGAIKARGSEVYERGEMATVIRWINQVPVTAYQDKPEFHLLLGSLQTAEGLAAAGSDTLRKVSADPRATFGERTCAQAVLSALVQWMDRPDVSVTAAERALSMLAEIDDDTEIPFVMGLTDARSLETLAMISGGRAHFLAGNIDEARHWLEEGLATEGAAYSIWRVNGLGSLALIEAWCGNIERAEHVVNEALTLASETGRLAHPSTADAHLARALCLLERGEPHNAALSLHEGTVRAEANRRTQLAWIGRLELALYQAAGAKPDEATATMQVARSKMGEPPPVVSDRLLALRSRLLRLGGVPDQALRTAGDTASRSSSLVFESAAAALTLDRPELARKIISGSPAMTESTEPLATVEHQLLLSWMADAEGAVHAAREHLVEAMAVAERHSLVEVFVRAGPIVVGLVSGLSDFQPPFRELILKRARQAHSPPPGGDLVDPLTDRELEVLSYLPSRFTNTQLAEKCYVSVNTIKTHMAHIYRKLDVANRNGAIARAQEIGLL